VLSFEEQMARAEKQRKEALADIERGNTYQDEVEELEIDLADIDKQLAETEEK